MTRALVAAPSRAAAGEEVGKQEVVRQGRGGWPMHRRDALRILAVGGAAGDDTALAAAKDFGVARTSGFEVD